MTSKEIKELRAKVKMTQKDFAIKLKVDVRTVQNYERGKTKPSKAVIRRLERLREKYGA